MRKPLVQKTQRHPVVPTVRTLAHLKLCKGTLNINIMAYEPETVLAEESSCLLYFPGGERETNSSLKSITPKTTDEHHQGHPWGRERGNVSDTTCDACDPLRHAPSPKSGTGKHPGTPLCRQVQEQSPGPVKSS